MHFVFISLPHCLLSIINTIISAYPVIENVYKVSIVDLDKAFDTNIITTTKQALIIKQLTALTVILTFISLNANYTHRTRC